MTVSAHGVEPRARTTGCRRRIGEPALVSLLECRLETGRTHQIRVHLAAIGHPVVGDGRYGGAARAIHARGRCCTRERSAFVHPVTGERSSSSRRCPLTSEAVLAELPE